MLCSDSSFHSSFNLRSQRLRPQQLLACAACMGSGKPRSGCTAKLPCAAARLGAALAVCNVGELLSALLGAILSCRPS